MWETLKERFFLKKLYIDHERFKKQRNSVQQQKKIRKRTSWEINSKRIPKSLTNCGKYLKILACLLKQPQYQKYVLKKTIFAQFDDKQNANTLKNFYTKLASDLIEKLPTTKDISRENFVKKYYSAMNVPFQNSFKLRNTKREKIYKILINIE